MKITANRLLIFLFVVYFFVSKTLFNVFLSYEHTNGLHYGLSIFYLGVWLIYIFYIIDKRTVSKSHIKFSIIIWSFVLATCIGALLLGNLNIFINDILMIMAIVFLAPLCPFKPFITAIIAAAILIAFIFVKRLEDKEDMGL